MHLYINFEIHVTYIYMYVLLQYSVPIPIYGFS